MKALDLFCKAGGVTRGLQLAGYHVTGVDIDPQPHYIGDVFIQADALTVDLSGYDLIWASPPCQGYSRTRTIHKRQYVDLVAAVRQRLQAWGGPYIIENVPEAPLHNPVTLCGVMFGLRVQRHRAFESNCLLLVPGHRPHRGTTGPKGSYCKGFAYVTVAGHNFNLSEGQAAMGIDWMNQHELAQAIPPAYSEYLGRMIWPYLTRRAA